MKKIILLCIALAGIALLTACNRDCNELMWATGNC